MRQMIWACATVAAIVLWPATPVRGQERGSLPWDYDPYRVMIWIAGVDAETTEAELRGPVLNFLDRDFAAVWRTDVAAAPPETAVLARRDFDAMDYDQLTAKDPVVALKRDHEHAARIRFPSDVAEKVGRILATANYAGEVARQAESVGDAALDGIVERFEPVDGDLLTVAEKWSDEATEAVLLPRGMALMLDPQPKLIELAVAQRASALFEQNDKVFLVLIDSDGAETAIAVREIDCLTRMAGPVVRDVAGDTDEIPAAIGHAVTAAFAPMVRLDDVGTQAVRGRVRAGGLVTADDSPAAIQVGDFLQPVLRRDDRNGDPMFLGVVDWTYLAVTEQDGPKVAMKIHSGRAGALQGRSNNRTFRIGLKVRPFYPATTLRLHAKGDPDSPLVGYDVYERDLESDQMTFLGHTDWDGRLQVEKSGVALRLLYVKNGGAVLARLPLVPGQSEREVADLVGDDVRLQAEAYIRGVQNAIIDLVAIRNLLGARIRMRIEEGNFDEAYALLDALRKEPTYEKLADDMAVTQTVIKSSNRSEQRKIDNMFAETRKLLVQHINPSLVRRLESEIAAKASEAEAEAPEVEEETGEAEEETLEIEEAASS